MGCILRLICLLFLLILPGSSYARSPVAGWDFEIKQVSSKGTNVYVEVCSHSSHGLNGPVMIICNVAGRDFVKQSIHFNSGDCRTVMFDIPTGLVFPEWETAKKIAGSKPPGYGRRQNIAVSVKGGGLFGIGYGLWQFDYWSGQLDFFPD
jgi:hypothetical protein